MSSINFINESWEKRFDDKDFLDKKKLVGRVYHLMLQGAIAQTADDRHDIAVSIVAEVANSMFPCCTKCGKAMRNIVCRDCKIKDQGILGTIN